MADNLEVLQAHKRLWNFPRDAVCEILHAPNASSVTSPIYAVSIGPNILSRDTVPHPSSLLLNEYHVLNRTESSLDAAQSEPFSKIVNLPPRSSRGARQRARSHFAPRRIATRHIVKQA